MQCLPGIVLGTGDTVVNERVKYPYVSEATFPKLKFLRYESPSRKQYGEKGWEFSIHPWEANGPL